MVSSSWAQSSSVASCSGVAAKLGSREGRCDIGSLLAKTFSYPKVPRWIRTPPPYDRVLERPSGYGLMKRLYHIGFALFVECLGQVVLRKYDCTEVQVRRLSRHSKLGWLFPPIRACYPPFASGHSLLC